MIDDMDINGGDVLDGVSLEDKGQEIFDKILRGRLGREDQVGAARLRRQRVRALADRRDDVRRRPSGSVDLVARVQGVGYSATVRRDVGEPLRSAASVLHRCGWLLVSATRRRARWDSGQSEAAALPGWAGAASTRRCHDDWRLASPGPARGH